MKREGTSPGFKPSAPDHEPADLFWGKLVAVIEQQDPKI
jgi:hypothetical protein